MAHQKDTFYVTTPIYYGTAKPHLGSLYSTLLADAAKRWHSLLGKESFFLVGTDEHGQKVAQAAAKAQQKPREFVDSFIQAYKSVWADYSISYDHFIRTTDPEHAVGVQKWIEVAQKNDDIYKSEYKGWYCTPCESYVTAEEVKTAPSCDSCDRETVFVSEESYFFRLSKYQDALLKFYEDNPTFITPKERANEIISFVKSGLKDLCISRSTIDWGIPFPGDEKHVVYVWADALNNYITALGYGDPAREVELKKWWPADLQVLGKDIVRFHAVYWPAFLMSSGLAMPQQLLVHGWIKIDDKKMSKSLGNAIDPVELCKTYGADQVRYYLMRYMAITQDSSFSIAELEQKINSDLVNDLGNLLNRTLALALKNNLSDVPNIEKWNAKSKALSEQLSKTIAEYQTHLENGMFHLALARLWEQVGKANSYFHEHEPWKLAKTDPSLFAEVISAVCHNLHAFSMLLWPVMPNKMEEVRAIIGSEKSEIDTLCSWNRSFDLKKSEPLFKKIDLKKKTNDIKTEKKSVQDSNIITIDDVAKVELRVGTITACDEVPKSSKLYALQVDFGDHGARQILAGIKKSYAADELVGKQAVFIFNLKPRPMMGTTSEGMLFVAQDADGKSNIIFPEKAVPNGTKLQ